MKSRKKVVATCGIVALLFAILMATYGYDNTWRLWNLPVQPPHFADLRTITHGAESYAQGFDPMIENPAEPWQRPMNYPRVWQSLYFLGVDRTHTTMIGIMLIVSFLVGICLVLPNANNNTIAMVFAAVLSPATLLGVERGNIDLLMFFFVALSVSAIQRSYLLATLAILAGFVLKLFPIFGVAVLFKAERSRFILYMAVILAAASLYTYFILPDLLLIREGTPRSTSNSYGMNVCWTHLSMYDANLSAYTRLLSYLAVVFIFVASFAQLIVGKTPSPSSGDSRYLDAFRAGAAIYIGTFLLGNNWDYRLIFLTLTIPQLVLWSQRSADRITVISKVVLLSIYMTMWYLVISWGVRYLPHGNMISFALDELFSWLAFGGLVYLLLWSLPAWTREHVRCVTFLESRPDHCKTSTLRLSGQTSRSGAAQSISEISKVKRQH